MQVVRHDHESKQVRVGPWQAVRENIDNAIANLCIEELFAIQGARRHVKRGAGKVRPESSGHTRRFPPGGGEPMLGWDEVREAKRWSAGPPVRRFRSVRT